MLSTTRPENSKHSVACDERLEKHDVNEKLKAVAVMDFDGILIESIDETITSILGGTILQATYRFLANQCGITREHIPSRLDEFDAALLRMFGVGGSTLSRAIAKTLWAKLGWEFIPIRSKRLVDYVNEANERLK